MQSDPYWSLPATDTPRALHRVFDHLDDLALQARRGGGIDPTILLNEIGQSLRTRFLVQGIQNAAFDTNSNLSLSTLESLLRSLDLDGDGLVKLSDFPTSGDRMSVVGRKISDLAIAARLVSEKALCCFDARCTDFQYVVIRSWAFSHTFAVEFAFSGRRGILSW